MPGSLAARSGPPRAVLLLAVILGVLAMHHVATAVPAAAQPHPAAHVEVALPAADAPLPDHDGGHGGGQHMLAACLAVLTTGAALLLTLLLFGVVTDPGGGPDRRRPAPVRVGRGPPFPRPTSRRLAALCLLRV